MVNLLGLRKVDQQGGSDEPNRKDRKIVRERNKSKIVLLRNTPSKVKLELPTVEQVEVQARDRVLTLLHMVWSLSRVPEHIYCWFVVWVLSDLSLL